MSDKLSGTTAAGLIATMRDQGRLEPEPPFDPPAAATPDGRPIFLVEPMPYPPGDATVERAREIRHRLMRQEVKVQLRTLIGMIDGVADGDEVPDDVWEQIDLVLLLRKEAG